MRIDAALSELLSLLPADTTVIVMSDHGFGPLHHVVNLNNLFIAAGLMTLKAGVGVRARQLAARHRRLDSSAGACCEHGNGSYWISTTSIGHERPPIPWATWGRSSSTCGDGSRRDASHRTTVRRSLTRVIEALHTLHDPGLSLPVEVIWGKGTPAVGPDLHVILDGNRTVLPDVRRRRPRS